MPDINITVAHKVAVSDTQTIVCDNSDYTVHWTLDEEWSAYDTKTMRTIYMDGTFEDKVFSGDTIELPVCTVPGAVQIGLFAGNIRTSRVAILRALPSVRSAAGAPADPTPDVYDQLMELIKGMGGASQEDIAKAVADYLAAHPIEETDPTVPEWAKAEITGATIGQIAVVAAVDASGVPTAWSSVDMPSGGGGETWEAINTITLSDAVNTVTINQDSGGNAIALKKVRIVVEGSATANQDLFFNNARCIRAQVVGMAASVGALSAEPFCGKMYCFAVTNIAANYVAINQPANIFLGEITITDIKLIVNNSGTFSAGTKITIQGVRA